MGDYKNIDNETSCREYEEIFLIILKYQSTIPKVVKNIGKEEITQLSEEGQFFNILISLNWQIDSLSNSVIMMNHYKKYNEAAIFLKTMMEITLLLQYLYQNPDESKRWLEFQELCLFKASKKKEYQKHVKMNFNDFKKFLKKKGYKQVIKHIDDGNYKNAKWFNPSFIRQSVDHKQFFKIVSNAEVRQRLNDLYSIFSNYTHPTFTSFEGPYNDVEIEIENLKMALSFIDVVCKLFQLKFYDFLSEDLILEFYDLNLAIMKILDKTQYDRLLDQTNKNPDISKDTIGKMKKNGLLIRPSDTGTRIQSNEISPAEKELIDEYKLEMDKNEILMKRLLLIHSSFYSIEENIQEIYKNIKEEKLINAGKNKLFLKILFSFHRVISCFFDSIITVNHYKKYSEAHILLRYIFESIFLIQYLHQYPNEVNRWFEVQDMFITRHTEMKNNRWYKDLDLFQFKSYLLEKGYSEIVDEIDQYNFDSAKWFSHSFLKKKVDYERLFHTHNKNIFKSIQGIYDIDSKYSHPSIVYFLLKNERDIEEEVVILSRAYYYFNIFNEKLLSEYGELVPNELVGNIESLINKANEKIFVPLY